MRKLFGALLVALLLPALTFAQDHSQTYKQHHRKTRIKFDLGADAAVPMGNFSDDISAGLGGSMWLGYDLSEQARICASTAYIDYISSIPNTNNTGYIPFRVGASYLPFTNFHLDASIGIGTFFMKQEASAGFLFCPAIGYTIADRVDLSVRYEGVTASELISVVAFRLAYRIRI